MTDWRVQVSDTALIRVGFDLGTFLPKVINKHWPTSKDQSLRGSRTASSLPTTRPEAIFRSHLSTLRWRINLNSCGAEET